MSGFPPIFARANRFSTIFYFSGDDAMMLARSVKFTLKFLKNMKCRIETVGLYDGDICSKM